MIDSVIIEMYFQEQIIKKKNYEEDYSSFLKSSKMLSW